MPEISQENPIIASQEQATGPESLDVYKTGWFYKFKQRIKWMTPKKKLFWLVLVLAIVIIGAVLYFVFAGQDDPAMRLVDSSTGQSIDGQTWYCGNTYTINVMTDVDPSNHPNQNGQGVTVAGADLYFDPIIFSNAVIDSSGSNYSVLRDEAVDFPASLIQVVREAPSPGLTQEGRLLTTLRMTVDPVLADGQTTLRFYDEIFGDPTELDSGFIIDSGDVLDVNYDLDGSGGSYTINIECDRCPFYTCQAGEDCPVGPSGLPNWYNERIACCNQDCQAVAQAGNIQLCSQTQLVVTSFINSVDFSWCTTPNSSCNINIYNVEGRSMPPGTQVGSDNDSDSRLHNFSFSGLEADAAHSYNITCQAAGYEGLSLSGTFNTLGEDDLIISNLTVSNITASRATISWTTNKLSDSQIYYGTAQNISSSVLSMAHSIDLVGLTPDTTYTYYVISATTPGQNCTGMSPTCSRSALGSFRTRSAAASPDTNIILKVDRDRVCDEWLYCDVALEVLDTKKNPPAYDDVCFSLGLCNKLDEGGRCISVVPTNQAELTRQHPAQVNQIRYLSGYSKAGLDWGYRCVNNGLSCSCPVGQDECQDTGVCGSDESQRCVRARIDGYYPYSAMREMGLPISIPNGNFEDGSSRPWRSYANGGLANDTSDKVNSVLRVEPDANIAHSGISSWSLTSRIEDATYVVSFRAKTDDPAGQNIYVEIGPYNGNNFTQFSYYDPNIGATTNVINLKPYWQEYVMFIDQAAVDDALKLSIVQASSYNASHGLADSGEYFYIDNISMKSVLSVSESLKVARSCRMYPTQNAPACDYYDPDKLKDYKGWKGYCVEVDPGYQDRKYVNQPVCLQWWPVDVIQGEANIFADDEVVGYTGRTPLYYCLEADGYHPYIRDNWNGGERRYYGSGIGLHIAPPVPPESGCASTGGANDECVDLWTGDTLGGIIDNDVRFNITSTPLEREWWNNGAVEKLEVELHVAGWDPFDPSVPGLHLHNGKIVFDPKQGDLQSYAASWSGASFSLDGDCDGDNNRCAAVQVNFANIDSANAQTNPYLRFHFVDRPAGANYFRAKLIYYLREPCGVIVQVVTVDGENTAWTQRVKRGGWTQSNELAYDYEQDYTPYGASVVGEPGYDPGEWMEPLYFMPANTQGMQKPYQVRAGSPYGLSEGGTLGSTQCIAGIHDDLGKLCTNAVDCGVSQAGTMACSGINLDESQINVLTSSPVGWQGGVERVSQLFARSYGIWRWEQDTNGIWRYVLQEGDDWDITDSGNLPQVNHLWLGNREGDGNFIIFGGQGAAKFSFTSWVDANQLPLVRYTVDWGDGADPATEGGLRIAGRGQNNPHVLLHHYQYDTSCDRGFGYCEFTPRVQIEDNWGLCNEVGDCSNAGAWTDSGESVVVFAEGVSGGTPMLSLDVTNMNYLYTSPDDLPLSQSFTITNSNPYTSDNLNWSVVAESWPSVNYDLSTRSGTLAPGSSQSVSLTINSIGNLSSGTYAGSITIQNTDSGEQQTINLSLEVNTLATIFVTSQSSSGDIAGWADNFNGCRGINPGAANANTLANCICTRLAENSNLVRQGEWHAWISYRWPGGTLSCGPSAQLTLYNASRNIASPENQNTSLFKTDGTIVGNDRSQLSSGSLLSPINLDENGNSCSGYVWTGTEPNGTCLESVAATDCANSSTHYAWSVSNNGSQGVYGSCTQSNSSWTSYGDPFSPYDSNGECNRNKRLYCIWYDWEIPDWWGLPVP